MPCRETACSMRARAARSSAGLYKSAARVASSAAESATTHHRRPRIRDRNCTVAIGTQCVHKCCQGLVAAWFLQPAAAASPAFVVPAFLQSASAFFMSLSLTDGGADTLATGMSVPHALHKVATAIAATMDL